MPVIFKALSPLPPGSGPSPPAKVTGVAASALSSSSIQLTWNSVPGATLYKILRGGSLITTDTASPFVDNGLSSSTSYTYNVIANNAVGDGPISDPASATTQGSSGGVVWLPGFVIRTGSGNATGFGGQLATVLSFLKKALDADINNNISHVMVPAQWANLESQAGGVYDGSWDASGNSGYAGVQKILNLMKSYTFKRGLIMSFNQTGNGAGADTSASFPTFFAPGYLNSPTFDGGCEWGGRSGYAGYPNVNTTFYNSNTAAHVVAMVTAYYNHFGPFDISTGNGIYAWELTNEMSLQTSSMVTASKIITAITSQYNNLQTQCPNMWTSMRPTFVNPGTAANYQSIFNAMRAARIANANEDGSNNFMGQNPHAAWCDQAYAAQGLGVGLTDFTANNLWTHIFNIENAELGKERSAKTAVPPADVGSGYIYDTAPTATVSGMMGGANRMKSSHVIFFADGQQGPNCNKFQFPLTDGTQPANPTPGPGAGLSTARPHLVDVITGNTAFAGISGPLIIPRTTKPTGW